jgi:hypothetical protein
MLGGRHASLGAAPVATLVGGLVACAGAPPPSAPAVALAPISAPASSDPTPPATPDPDDSVREIDAGPLDAGPDAGLVDGGPARDGGPDAGPPLPLGGGLDPLRGRCGSERWGGWEGTPACRRAARRSIPAAHRRCASDADCVLLGNSCDPHAVSRAHEARYRRWTGPCVPPGAGNCSGPTRATCAHGCCWPTGGGMPF